jgi:Mn2+/Fe2+ NRAMP family transporter
MKDVLKIALGIATSIGGFLDAGSIATAATAGAIFGYQLAWAIVVGTLCAVMLTEMLGRLACVSHHTLADGIRERLGFPYAAVPLLTEVIVDVLVLAAEIGGIAVALELLTGIPFRYCAPVAGFLVWVLLWAGTFDALEEGVSMAGLITLAFVYGAWHLHPSWRAIAAGMVPSAPGSRTNEYWFTAVSIIGAILSPYMLNFYAAGAVEEKWTVKDLTANRIVATVGMAFGSVTALGILVLATLVLKPRDIEVESYQQAALTLAGPFGWWGVIIFAASLGIACLAAALQVSLNLGYVVSQQHGWNWGEDLRPCDDARFATVYTLGLVLATAIMTTGIDPIRLTTFSMALNAVAAPFVVFPLLILMNDKAYIGTHGNGAFSNVAVGVITVLAFLIAIVAIPLEVLGG